MLTHPLFLYLIVALALLNPRIARSADTVDSRQTTEERIEAERQKIRNVGILSVLCPLPSDNCHKASSSFV
jgi:hypothetical protein